MKRVGMSCADNLLTPERFLEMERCGIAAVEIGCFYEPQNLDFKKVGEYANSHKIELWSCHLPYKGMGCLVQDSRELRMQTLALHQGLIERAAEVGVDKFVIHPSGILRESVDRSEAKAYSMEALDILAEFAHKHGAKIAVENMCIGRLGECCDELLELIGANDKLRICFDVNHLLRDPHEAFAERIRDKLITVHISDYAFQKQCHWLPGEGKIDWPAIHKILCGIGYADVWMYEVAFGTNAMRSRPLAVSDLYNNAMEIFAGKKPGRI